MASQAKKPLRQFRGRNFYQYSLDRCAALPQGVDGVPSNFLIARIHPLDPTAKKFTQGLPERNVGWTRTSNPQVVYGLERWGELIPGDYQEWFSIAIIFPSLMSEKEAIDLASRAGVKGILTREEF